MSLVLVSALASLTFSVTAFAMPGVVKEKGAPTSRSRPDIVAGTVRETFDSGGYTYVNIERQGEGIWVAAPSFKATVGQQMAFPYGDLMSNFKSKTLNRTFDKIIFTSGPVEMPGATGGRPAGPKSKGAGKTTADAKVKVEKAAGQNAYTVSELFANNSKLHNKEVVVRGKVVKVSEGIMNTNWLHLQDGTGSAEKGDNDLVVTSDSALPAVGDTVTVTGRLLKDKDFGYGYKYNVMIEKATVKK